MRRFYFCHMPKTGGTTVTDWLDFAFGPLSCKAHLWSQLLCIPKPELAHFTLFRGHFYAALQSYIKSPLHTFVALRRPVERSISHYRHIMRSPDHYFHELAREQQTFANFLNDVRTRPMIENFQTRMLSLRFDPEALQLAARVGSGYGLERSIETSAIAKEPRRCLGNAKQFLDRCAAVGVTERLDDFTRALSRLLGVEMPASQKILNKSERDGIDLSSAEERALGDALQLDFELYDYAASKAHEISA